MTTPGPPDDPDRPDDFPDDLPFLNDPRRFGDAQEQEIRRAFLSAVYRARDVMDLADLARFITQGNTTALEQVGEQMVAQGLIPNLNDFMRALQNISMASAVSALDLTRNLTRTSERALDFLRSHAATQVQAISFDTMQSIREVLSEGMIRGIGSRPTGRLLRDTIGLLPSHARAVVRYEAQLRSQENIPEAQVVRRATTYRNRLLAYRANNISRTETMIASHAGLVEGWRAAVEEGLLDEAVQMRWVVTEDDRLCERCYPMDDVTVSIWDSFTATHKGFPDGMPTGESRRRPRKTGLAPGRPPAPVRDASLDGELVPLRRPLSVPHPPLHPSCRCTLVLAVEPE